LHAIAEVEKYLDSVMSGSFEITSEDLMSCLHRERNQCSNITLNDLSGVPLQALREMRHRVYLKATAVRLVIAQIVIQSGTHLSL
jgi:hypothetical protein